MKDKNLEGFWKWWLINIKNIGICNIMSELCANAQVKT